MNFALPVVRIETQSPPGDTSMWLEELAVKESTREIIRRGWPWYMIELGGGIRTVSAQMLDERSDEDILSIPGMKAYRLQEIRRACRADPGLVSNLYPNIRRGENAATAMGAFTEVVDNTRFDSNGRPLPHVPATAEAPTVEVGTPGTMVSCPADVVPGVACVLPEGHEGPHAEGDGASSDL